MPTDTIDTVLDASAQTPASGVADAANPASIIADLKSRQAGLSRTVDKQMRDLQAAQEQIARLSEEREVEAAKIRNEAAEYKRQAEQYRTDFEAANKAKTDTERQLAVLSQKEQTRSQVATSHPSLLGVLDDLKGRGEFVDDAAYTAYLTRMQDTLFKSSPSYGVGAVPSTARPATTPNTGNQRTVAEIQDDLWNPALLGKVPELEVELEAAMKRRN